MASSSTNDLSNDQNRKPPKSSDPAWKYEFWLDLSNKDKTQCSLCQKEISGGAQRLKKHLVGGYKDVTKCPNTTTKIMKAHLDKGKRKKDEPQPQPQSLVDEYREDDVVFSRSSKIQKTINFITSQSKTTKSIASMVRKSPEEVVEVRHSKGPYQTTIENSTKSKEDKRRVRQHIANFFYENGISFNAAHSRSYEIMVESIGQFGSGLKPPTYHELRVPLLETANSETEKIRERHEKSWKRYECSLMCDRWTDKRTRHLINFLVNSQDGTFFVCSTDVSSKVQDAKMLATLIEEQINLVGKEYVVQVVTDNGANFKAAGRKLCKRIPILYRTDTTKNVLALFVMILY